MTLHFPTVESAQPWAWHTMLRLRLSDRGLDVIFADGLKAHISPASVRDDLGNVVDAELALDGESIKITTDNGRSTEVGWDFFRYVADPNFRKDMQNADKDADLAVGAAIRLWRTKRGWTQEFLAARSGVARVTLSRVENGAQEATLSTLKQLAVALGVMVGELVTGQTLAEM